MPASDEAVRDAVAAIAGIPRVRMDPQALAEDALVLSWAFDDEEYRAAAANTCRALRQLADGMVDVGTLRHSHAGWSSYHYQHRVEQGARADMRIMFQEQDGKIVVRGFGRRDVPSDFYARMAELRKL